MKTAPVPAPRLSPAEPSEVQFLIFGIFFSGCCFISPPPPVAISTDELAGPIQAPINQLVPMGSFQFQHLLLRFLGRQSWYSKPINTYFLKNSSQLPFLAPSLLLVIAHAENYLPQVCLGHLKSPGFFGHRVPWLGWVSALEGLTPLQHELYLASLCCAAPKAVTRFHPPLLKS